MDAALERYQAGVRQDAPYLPRNIDFIAEANGLDGEAEVATSIQKFTMRISIYENWLSGKRFYNKIVEFGSILLIFGAKLGLRV